MILRRLTEIGLLGRQVRTNVSIAELKKMPRKTLKVLNPHEKKTEVYEGVLLQVLLRRAGVPQGDGLRGATMAIYVLAEAADGYRVVFSLAELDSNSFQDRCPTRKTTRPLDEDAEILNRGQGSN